MTLSTLQSVLVLRIPEEQLADELPAARRILNLDPGGWSGLAGVGKVLRYQGDRAGLAMLADAGDAYLRTLRNQHPSKLLTAANLFRLAGEQARAEELLRAMRDGLAADPTARDLVEVHVLLGEDRQALDLDQRTPSAGRRGPGLRGAAIVELASARLARDAERCDGVIDWLDSAIRKERETPSGTGHVNLHDWLEVALVIQSELSGSISPRLRLI
ncbi:MAG: hypothetical protein M3P48_08305 [Actinomycetota bacterium]|jgi:hypothetical protein|nr:hypothetical protein [Actinomycetota bacterium]